MVDACAKALESGKPVRLESEYFGPLRNGALPSWYDLTTPLEILRVGLTMQEEDDDGYAAQHMRPRQARDRNLPGGRALRRRLLRERCVGELDRGRSPGDERSPHGNGRGTHRRYALPVPSENLIRPLSGRTTLVPMVQSPDLGERGDLSKVSPVHRSRLGRILHP
jgi:hypothetical protein